MATVPELIAQGKTQLETLRLEPFYRSQLEQTLTAIDRAVGLAREQASQALTVLRDPALASRPAHAMVAAAGMVEEALGYLDGTDEAGS